MLNYTPDEIAAKSFLDLLLTARERERFSERIAKEQTTSDFETRFASKAGDACWVNLSWSTIDEKTVSCSVMNINARKLAEKLNNDNMMKYRQLTEHSPTGILIIQNRVIRYANPSFMAFSGYSLAEIAGKPLDLFIDPLDRETLRGLLRKMGPEDTCLCRRGVPVHGKERRDAYRRTLHHAYPAYGCPGHTHQHRRYLGTAAPRGQDPPGQ